MIRAVYEEQESQAAPVEEQLPGIRPGFELGLGDWALLTLGSVITLAAITYWVVGLCP